MLPYQISETFLRLMPSDFLLDQAKQCLEQSFTSTSERFSIVDGGARSQLVADIVT